MTKSKLNQHSATLDEVFSAVNFLSAKTDDRFGTVDKKITDLGELVHDVLGTVNDFATETSKQFKGVNLRLDKVEGRLDKVETRMDGLETKVDGLETRMVTKDYLDDKMSDLSGDFVVMTRKEDTKLKTLVGVLAGKKVIN